ncbi:MAG: gamma-glutamyl-gamma-aminobutyrate hydrolase family protein [Planctomycetales bacterium]|nr:gamma-glutamyl-gamma-aminobutyrate hydrolase family protein [Planctomycetales bacterium]
MSRTVVLGVTSDLVESAGRLRAWVPAAYLEAVEEARAVPLVLAPTLSPASAAGLLGRVDGLVLIGGPDYDPGLYGQRQRPETELVHPRRGAFDLALARAALRRGVPVLGICGGCQLLNVALGGSLLQHVPAEWPGAVAHGPAPGAAGDARHEVAILPGTRLAGVLRRRRATVVSHHHQAVGRIGRGLRVSALAPDGLTEAIEERDGRFVIGVQWHPERGGSRDSTRGALFSALAKAARLTPSSRV